MPATLEPTLGLNLLTPKTLERMGRDLPSGLYEPLRWCVTAFAEVSRPMLRARNFVEVTLALNANLAKFAVVRMRFLDFLLDLVGGEGRQLLSMLRDVSKEITDEFLDEAEAVAGKSASQYLAQTLALAEAAMDRIDRAVRTTGGFGWTLHPEQEITLRTWALRSDALLIICAIGVSEPENVADQRLLAEVCRGAYETMSRYFSILERDVSTGQSSAREANGLLAEFAAEEPEWVHALEVDDWAR